VEEADGALDCKKKVFAGSKVVLGKEGKFEVSVEGGEVLYFQSENAKEWVTRI